MDFEFVAHHACAAGLVETDDFFPVNIGDGTGDRLALDVRLESNE